MDIDISIDRGLETPIYRQISEQITTMVQKGLLKSGDRLPPGRQLAEAIDTARGTVTKAYEELERNKVIESIQGKGSFVSLRQDVMEKERKEKAINLINGLLNHLEQLNFSAREIRTLFHLLTVEREQRPRKIQVATVDCNPEALTIFRQQLCYLTHVELTEFLLNEIKEQPDPGSLFHDADLILTTSTHYDELQDILAGFNDKIIQAAVSPSQQTIIDLATIKDGATIGIICRSKQFLHIILRTLRSFRIDLRNVSSALEEDLPEVAKFLDKKNILIIPPDSSFETDGEYDDDIHLFKNMGGKIVRFAHQIERGSLIYIEEQISKLSNRNGNIPAYI